MKNKLFICLLILLSNISCSSDEDYSNNINNFQEPIINFGLTREEFKNLYGEPINIIGDSFYYPSRFNGEKELIYVFLETTFNSGEYVYKFNNAHYIANQNNVNFLLDYYTNKLGIPEFIQDGSSVDSYVWRIANTSIDYKVSLNYSRDINREDAILFTAYTYY